VTRTLFMTPPDPRNCRLREQIVTHFVTRRKATGSRAIIVKGRSCAILSEAGVSKNKRLSRSHATDSMMP
jgi:hypothetical protein